MIRIWAIIERDLRRFRRSPALMVMSMVMPLIQLVVLGYAFGGKIKNLEIGVVDQDHGVPAIKLQEMFQAVAANARTFATKPYLDEAAALRDLRQGRIDGVISIPPEFSRKVLAGASPRVALIEDNTDQFASSALEGVFPPLLAAYGGKPSGGRLTADVTLATVEVYPYVPYIQFLLPGTIVLAVFVSAMIGGGIIFIDDKARGLHEGYLVTPITKFELILGFNLAGAAKAILSGFILITIGSLIAGIPDPLNVLRLARMLFLVVCTALALISMMFLLVVRVSDPLLPRALFGVLNTLLFFPSGAVYPIKAFPAWMRVITAVDPFTYAVDGFKNLALKNTGLIAIAPDIAFLLGFTVIAMGLATALFKRTPVSKLRRKIAIVGERNPEGRGHQGIEASLADFRRRIDPDLEYAWVGTESITAESADALLRDVTGIWCAPGSPYASTAGALLAIRHARIEKKAFLGTCGGFQHALMEFAQNVLHRKAEHQEEAPTAADALIVKLSCSLVGATGKVIASPAEGFASIYGGAESTEEFHCNYGFNAGWKDAFQGTDMVFVARDESGEVRAFKLKHHPFFVGTLFQPERKVLAGSIHPLVRSFFEAASP